MDAYSKVQLARSMERGNGPWYINQLIDDFHKLSGDRIGNEDGAIVGGVGFLGSLPVTVIAHYRGRSLEENKTARFGMPLPSGYRKVMRLMKQAEKFNRPVITIIDTPGAYPGIDAEDDGQAIAIAECIQTMALLEVPTIAVVVGEGGSGGALAMAVADKLYMLEHSVFSVISPEACASILYKDAKKAKQAAQALCLTANDLYNWQLCDDIILEHEGASGQESMIEELKEKLIDDLSKLLKVKTSDLLQKRYNKYRKVGNDYVAF